MAGRLIRGHQGVEGRCRTQSLLPSPALSNLNNVLEQDDRFVKIRIAASLWFRSVDGALRTIQGYEAMNMIQGTAELAGKGRYCCQVRFIERIFGLAA